MRPAEFSVLPVSRLRIQRPSSGCGRTCERATDRTSSPSGPETFKISQCTSSRRFGTLLAGKFDIPSQDDHGSHYSTQASSLHLPMSQDGRRRQALVESLSIPTAAPSPRMQSCLTGNVGSSADPSVSSRRSCFFNHV